MKYIPFFLIIFIIACEQIVEIDISEHESQLVLSSFYKSGDTRVVALLTKSISILSNEEPEDIWDAEIKLYENDVLLGDLNVEFDTIYRTYKDLDSLGNIICIERIDKIRKLYLLELSEPLKREKTYKMTAETSGYETISATQQIPPLPPNILSAEYKYRSRFGMDGFIMDATNVLLEDIPNQDNYFELSAFIKIKIADSCQVHKWRRRWTESFTLGVEKGYDSSIIKDDFFDAGTYNIELLTPSTDTTYYDIKLEVSSIPRDKYLFYKSIQDYNNAQGNPFAEPVIVHTNVENGQGIFSMENTTEVIID